MLRPRKKYTVYDLQQLKGKRCLTHIHVKSPEEAAAAAEAGVDLMSCSYEPPEAQAKLPLLIAAGTLTDFSNRLLSKPKKRDRNPRSHAANQREIHCGTRCAHNRT